MMQPGKKTCYYSLLITLILVGIYLLGQGIILPGINSEFLSSISQSAPDKGQVGNIFTLGYSPFLSGFIIVEIFSLVIPAGRRLRRGSINGRAKLNRAAMYISIALCLFQSLITAIAMENSGTIDGLVLVMNPGWIFRLITCLTLTAGTIAIFYIAQLISRKGIANGFCILIATDILSPIIRQLDLSLDSLQKTGSIHQIQINGSLVVVILILLIYYHRTIATTAMTVRSHGTLKLDLPVFPQGIVALTWAFSVFSLSSIVSGLSDYRSHELLPNIWLLLPGTAVLILVFSAFGILLFSSKKRVLHNLPPGIRLEDDFEHKLRNQAIKSTSILVVGSLVLLSLERLFERGYILDYAGLIFISSIALDVIDQWKFSWKHGRGIELIQLDNTHLASFLKNLLQSKGIDTLVQTYRYRRLLFFFGPLFKMRILVAPEESERAMELIDRNSMNII